MHEREIKMLKQSHARDLAGAEAHWHSEAGVSERAWEEHVEALKASTTEAANEAAAAEAEGLKQLHRAELRAATEAAAKERRVLLLWSPHDIITLFCFWISMFFKSWLSFFESFYYCRIF